MSTFREAVERFEKAAHSRALMRPADDCVRITEEFWTAKAELLSFDLDGERAAIDRYADEHANEAIAEPVQPAGISPHSMIEPSNLGKWIWDTTNVLNKSCTEQLRK